MDLCFGPQNPDVAQTSQTQAQTYDTSPSSKRTDHGAERKELDYQQLLGVLFKLIMLVTGCAVICLTLYMARTDDWHVEDSGKSLRSILIAIIAMCFAVAFMIHGSNKERQFNWTIGKFGVVDRIGDRITAAGIASCGTLALVCFLLFATFPRVDGYQDGELGAFLFGLCCLTLTLLYGLVSHILFSRKEIEVDASVFVAA